jgi:hypothetical protein
VFIGFDMAVFNPPQSGSDADIAVFGDVSGTQCFFGHLKGLFSKREIALLYDI